MLALYQEQYYDLNVRHFREKLAEDHDIQLSYTWVFQALVGREWCRPGATNLSQFHPRIKGRGSASSPRIKCSKRPFVYDLIKYSATVAMAILPGRREISKVARGIEERQFNGMAGQFRKRSGNRTGTSPF